MDEYAKHATDQHTTNNKEKRHNIRGPHRTVSLLPSPTNGVRSMSATSKRTSESFFTCAPQVCVNRFRTTIYTPSEHSSGWPELPRQTSWGLWSVQRTSTRGNLHSRVDLTAATSLTHFGHCHEFPSPSVCKARHTCDAPSHTTPERGPRAATP
jgi:hypothetical protein